MLAVVFPRRTRAFAGAFAALVCVAAVLPQLLESAQAGTRIDRLADRLIRLDPGARIGGNTQVLTAPGARLVGVPGRANFAIGLGPRQLILGGPEHDQLGARGAGARILGRGGHDLIHGGSGDELLAGGSGDDLIYGGPGRDELVGGPGNDRFVDRDGATLVDTGPGRNRVDVSDGDGDERVRCSPGSVNHINADRGDRIHPRCRAGASTVRYTRSSSEGPAADAAQQQPVSGDGSNNNPYTAACDDEIDLDCTVSAFASRSLSGLWKNEYVPAYKCPDSHPWLLNKGYAPGGTALPNGVEVAGLGPIAVSITGVSTSPDRYANGTATGFPNSSATSWSLGTNSYQVKLHCTNQVGSGYKD